jgi:acetolactate synthase-1/2/3 large subunit/5-guanidino-2-oxopentanoate decarboxylase
MVERPLGAQLSHMLKSRGVEVIFGIPGVHNVELYRGIEEAGLTHVLARHEQGAGFMADGYARATGRPGVAYVITGPGLTNILTPLGQAYSDSVPVLTIASCLNRADIGIGRARLHDMRDQQGAAAAVCDWSKTALDAATAYQLVDRALLEFASARPRPKAIHVPMDVLAATAPEVPPARPLPPMPAARDIAGVVARIAAARRPLFVFGGGARSGWRAAREVLARTQAASIATLAGRGIVDPSDPLYLGTNLVQADAGRVMARADLVIAVGTELSEIDLWRDPMVEGVPVIRVDIDPAEIADDTHADLTVMGDAAAFLADLATNLPERASGWDRAEVAAARERWRAQLEADRPGLSRVVDALKACLPQETQVYLDMTQLAYAAIEIWDTQEPGCIHYPYGYGTLGYALPAAIGGKVGTPQGPVVAIAGDYGLQYTIQELGTAVELGLPLPILVWDNGKLKEIEESMVRSQIAPNAVIARNPDFCKLAQAYGARAVRPASLEELAEAIRVALAADRPTLIHMTPDMA